MFGYQHRDQGAASRLEVSACALQDSRGRPVEGLLLDGARCGRLRTDHLLKSALATRDDPLFRDRVRLSHRGVAAHSGKFDRGIVAAGHRFSGELRLWSRALEDPDWERLLALLCDPRLRLGGGTRAGIGAVTLAGLHAASFDLRDPGGAAAFRALGPGLADTDGLKARALHDLSHPDRVRTLAIELKPRDFWRIGQGDAPVGAYGKEPDLLPKLEPVVAWNDGKAEIRARCALVPGSSVKGALAHRTAFHWNSLDGRFVEKMTPDEIDGWDKSEHCPGVRAVFGYAKARDKAGGRGMSSSTTRTST